MSSAESWLNLLDQDKAQFRSGKRLGDGIAPEFEDMAYSCAEQAFAEAWNRGIKWGWAQANLEAAHKANERMRSAFNFIYPAQAAEHAPQQAAQTSLTRYESMDPRWFASVIAYVTRCHYQVFGPIHALQSPIRQQRMPLEVVRFYQGVLRLGWRHGWQAGEGRAYALQERRDAKMGLYEQVEQEALQMEHSQVAQAASAVFYLSDEDLMPVYRAKGMVPPSQMSTSPGPKH